MRLQLPDQVAVHAAAVASAVSWDCLHCPYVAAVLCWCACLLQFLDMLCLDLCCLTSASAHSCVHGTACFVYRGLVQPYSIGWLAQPCSIHTLLMCNLPACSKVLFASAGSGFALAGTGALAADGTEAVTAPETEAFAAGAGAAAFAAGAGAAAFAASRGTGAFAAAGAFAAVGAFVASVVFAGTGAGDEALAATAFAAAGVAAASFFDAEAKAAACFAAGWPAAAFTGPDEGAGQEATLALAPAAATFAIMAAATSNGVAPSICSSSFTAPGAMLSAEMHNTADHHQLYIALRSTRPQSHMVMRCHRTPP